MDDYDCVAGEYCEIYPSSILTGNEVVGNNTTTGTGAVVLPKITVDDNAFIAAGAVVTENEPDNTLVACVPAIIKKIILKHNVIINISN